MTVLEHFLVLGAGAWGTALALHLARQGHPVTLWGHDPEHLQLMHQTHLNQAYLPDFPFPDNLIPCADLSGAFAQAGEQAIIFIVVPSHAFQETLKKIKPFLKPTTRILWATKGLAENGEFLHVQCEQTLGHHPIAVLSGPSFAQEVAKALPTAVTIATNNQAFGQALVTAFHSKYFRVYLSLDLIGVQLGGALKNVLAIAVGLSDGLGYGANARAALITRGLAELCRLALILGADLSTLMGLSGVGDVVLTCTDNQSRNRRLGIAIAQKLTFSEIQQTIGKVLEGKDNVGYVRALAQHHQIDMPISEQVYQVLFEGLSPERAVENLLLRAPGLE